MKADFKPIYITSFLDEQRFKSFVEETDVLINQAKNFVDYDEDFNRYYLNQLSTFKSLHNELNAWLELTLNRKTKPSYSFMVEYLENGFCPKHYDRSPCKYTITICLKQNKIFPLWVEGQTFDLEVNSMLLYSGTDHLHERPPVKDGFSRLVLFHYVDSDYDGIMS